MSSLKWLGVWGMTGVSSVNEGDLSRWSKSIHYVFEDPKGRHYFEIFASERGIDLPPGECTSFKHFTIRPITCNFK
jgi:hypothetical protein